MYIRLASGALIIGALMAVVPASNRSWAQSNEAGLSAPRSTTATVSSPKHRYWRHRGGKHPHYGSRRVRT